MARIVVDRVKCTGLGVCESLAEHVFQLTDDGDLVLLEEDITGDEELDAVRSAVAGCPAEALTLLED
jgi:ferredoxin